MRARRIDLHGESEGGTRVALLAPGGEGVPLPPAQEAELSESLQRGDFEDGFALLQEIKAQLSCDLPASAVTG